MDGPAWPSGGRVPQKGMPTNGYHGESGVMLHRQRAAYNVHASCMDIPYHTPSPYMMTASSHPTQYSTSGWSVSPTERPNKTRRDQPTLTFGLEFRFLPETLSSNLRARPPK